MFSKGKLLLFVLVIFSIVGCGSNVRWRHPTPSMSLIATAMKEAQKPRDIHGKDVNPDVLTNLKKLATEGQVEDFFLMTIDFNEIVYASGYTSNERHFRLNNPERFTALGLTNKPIRGFAYFYKGKAEGAAFAVPHMVRDENSRENMVLHTDPITPFKVFVLYQDGTVESFNLHSTERDPLAGRYATRQLDYFDGKLWLSLDFSRNYYVGLPYNK